MALYKSHKHNADTSHNQVDHFTREDIVQFETQMYDTLNQIKSYKDELDYLQSQLREEQILFNQTISDQNAKIDALNSLVIKLLAEKGGK